MPVFGTYFHTLAENWYQPETSFAKWTKNYKSKVIGHFIGPFQCVITGDLHLIRQIFTRNEFDGRPTSFPIKERSWGKFLGKSPKIR